MDLQYYGANCVRITYRKAAVIIDDNLAELGLKSVTKSGDIALHTMAYSQEKAEVKLLIDQPGEYEVSDVSIQGIAARAHIDNEDIQTATIYKIIAEDIRIVALGHIMPDLNDTQLEVLGTVDVLIIPVGGHGYTLDAIGALKLIKKIEPKMVIPTHYADPAIKYPVPQAELIDALKELAMEAKEPVAKLKLKAGELGEITQLVVLERQ